MYTAVLGQSNVNPIPEFIQDVAFEEIPNVISFENIINPEAEEVRHFIGANTIAVDFNHLQRDCIIPVFSKDNELTISHTNFIETVWGAAKTVFPTEQFAQPEIMVSHICKGRIPEARHKPTADLLESDKTIYYERMAFCIEIPSIYETIDGNRLNLTIGGVRALNRENLFSRKCSEKFAIFIGFKNMVCCNLCVSTDGYMAELRASNTDNLLTSVINLFASYKLDNHLSLMTKFIDTSITEHQFAQFLGKTRMYNYLPNGEKLRIPRMLFGDAHINNVAKEYYNSENFARAENREISVWKLYNLLTGANKSSYIDTILDRAENATTLTNGVYNALNGDADYRWFIS